MNQHSAGQKILLRGHRKCRAKEKVEGWMCEVYLKRRVDGGWRQEEEWEESELRESGRAWIRRRARVKIIKRGGTEDRGTQRGGGGSLTGKRESEFLLVFSSKQSGGQGGVGVWVTLCIDEQGERVHGSHGTEITRRHRWHVCGRSFFYFLSAHTPEPLLGKSSPRWEEEKGGSSINIHVALSGV